MLSGHDMFEEGKNYILSSMINIKNAISSVVYIHDEYIERLEKYASSGDSKSFWDTLNTMSESIINMLKKVEQSITSPSIPFEQAYSVGMSIEYTSYYFGRVSLARRFIERFTNLLSEKIIYSIAIASALYYLSKYKTTCMRETKGKETVFFKSFSESRKDPMEYINILMNIKEKFIECISFNINSSNKCDIIRNPIMAVSCLNNHFIDSIEDILKYIDECMENVSKNETEIVANACI